MNELITVSNKDGRQAVSAKELYLGLDLDKSQWARWYKTNILNNEFFKEGINWIRVRHNVEGNETMDFVITLDFGKHIAMMAKTKKSHAYRNYFIEVESQLKSQLPGTYKEALLQLVEQVEEKEKLQLENQQLKPKADYFDKYIENKGVMTIGVIAENYGMSAIAMNKLLHELGVQYKQSNTWRLYMKHKGKGYAHMESFDYSDSNGNLQVNPQLKWHPKGHHFIYELLKDNGVLPMIERKI